MRGERQEILRSNLTTQLTVYGKVTLHREELVAQMMSGNTINVEGYKISYVHFVQRSAIDLNNSEFPEDKVLIVQIRKEDQPSRKNLQVLSDLHKNIDLKHAAEEPCWHEIKRYYGRATNLFTVTLD